MKIETKQIKKKEMKDDTIYVEISKECSEASAKVYETLSDEEKQQMQMHMRHAFKTSDPGNFGNVPAGLLGIINNELTRRMFAGYIKIK